MAANLAHRFPVTLLFRNLKRLGVYRKAGSTVYIDGGRGMPVQDFPIPGAVEPAGSIEQLVVTTKAYDVVRALRPLVSRIPPSATVVLLHNGMGVYERVRELWPPTKAPHFVLGVTSNGVRKTVVPYRFKHTGCAPVHLAMPGVDSADECAANSLVAKFLRCTRLWAAQAMPYSEFCLAQYEKLIVNSAINPLTAILNCANGKLPELDKDGMIRSVVHEGCDVVQKYISRCTPELEDRALLRLDCSRMMGVLESVCRATASNQSSMLTDVQNGSRTEIDFVNGYIVRLGKEVHHPCLVNRTLSHLVNMSTLQSRSLLNSFTPLESLEEPTFLDA